MVNYARIVYTFSFLLAVIVLTSCGKGKSGDGTSLLDNSLSKEVLIATTQLEKTHPDCPAGGVSIETGIDSNTNGTLDADEVTQTKVICEGNQGLASLIRVYDEPEGENCKKGGKKILVGLDNNFDAELNTDEINDTQYLCNADDSNNPESIEPETSQISLISIVEEPAGDNCATGGKQINTGFDENGDGVLNGTEITQSSYICNGETGVAGEITRSYMSIRCEGPLENLTDLLWSYELHQLTSGDAIVTASIHTTDFTVGSLEFYSGQQLANGVKPEVKFVYDIVGAKNRGFWRIFLDEVTSKTYVIYTDTNQTTNPTGWSMPTDQCTTTLFE